MLWIRQATIYFYPRPPRGGRPQRQDFSRRKPDISIHALREEGDKVHRLHPAACGDFYPRPPRGGRPSVSHTATTTAQFLSTPSARRATVSNKSWSERQAISIHALREEGDDIGTGQLVMDGEFLSTPSARRATSFPVVANSGNTISIHALREEGDPDGNRLPAERHYFYPRPPRGGRRTPSWTSSRPSPFLSTPSARRATALAY